MQEFRDIYDWTPPSSGCAIALGRFDGVHLGHRALLERAVEHAAEHSLTPVCFSFQERTFPGAAKRKQLTTCEEKAALLESIGIEFLLHPVFEPPLIEMNPGQFAGGLLIGKWHAKLIVAGFDFHFGKDRAGNTDILKEIGKEHDVEIEIFPAFVIDGIPVKATNIRTIIREGRVAEAARLLGRRYSIHAANNPGRQFGREIGFPTINFRWPELKVAPKFGIYVVRLRLTGGDLTPSTASTAGWLEGVANFGLRPTVEPENSIPLLEVHILEDVPDQIRNSHSYGSDFEVEFIEFLREERQFLNVDELKTQIASDCDSARTCHRSASGT